jgi:hypothetical protein
MSITGNEIPTLVPAAFETMYIDFRYVASSKPTSAVYNWQATLSVTVNFILHQQFLQRSFFQVSNFIQTFHFLTSIER